LPRGICNTPFLSSALGLLVKPAPASETRAGVCCPTRMGPAGDRFGLLAARAFCRAYAASGCGDPVRRVASPLTILTLDGRQVRGFSLREMALVRGAHGHVQRKPGPRMLHSVSREGGVSSVDWWRLASFRLASRKESGDELPHSKMTKKAVTSHRTPKRRRVAARRRALMNGSTAERMDLQRMSRLHDGRRWLRWLASFSFENRRPGW
jgi:hypothetical protein